MTAIRHFFTSNAWKTYTTDRPTINKLIYTVPDVN